MAISLASSYCKFFRNPDQLRPLEVSYHEALTLFQSIFLEPYSGDTVNTAARMESSGQKNKIHISSQTMEQLVAAGKTHWIKKRESTVSLKGKGEMQTYWVKTIAPVASEATEVSDSSSDASYNGESGMEMRKSPNRVSESQRRLVVWNVEMLQRLLKKIIAMRVHDYQDGIKEVLEIEPYLRITTHAGETVLDEVKEILVARGAIDNGATGPVCQCIFPGFFPSAKTRNDNDGGDGDGNGNGNGDSGSCGDSKNETTISPVLGTDAP